jgi:serine/threonine-protein kinase
MYIVLDVISGPRTGQKVSIRPGQSCRIGRDEGAELAVPDDNYLSRLHFALEVDEVNCRLKDLGSTNGTFVNGERVAEALVGRGDLIAAGGSSFVVHMELEDLPPPPLTPQPVAKPATGSTTLMMKPYQPPES